MLIDRISSDLKASILVLDVVRRDTLRMLLSEINYEKIRVQRDLADADVISVLQKEVKKRNEAIVSWEASGRKESADAERAESAILQAYLPARMTEDEIRKWIVESGKLTGVTDFGQAMKMISPEFRGRADGKVVANIVKELTT